MILVDTSVWIDHLHHKVLPLADALEAGDVLMHPFVIGELACGTLRRRSEILGLLAALPLARVASDEETLRFVEGRRLMGKGMGYIDAHLLASAMITDSTLLWTRDRQLHAIASRLGVAHHRET